MNLYTWFSSLPKFYEFVLFVLSLLGNRTPLLDRGSRLRRSRLRRSRLRRSRGLNRHTRHIMVLQVTLDVQVRNLGIRGCVQESPERIIQKNLLTILEVVGPGIVLDRLGHIRTGNGLPVRKIQESLELLGHLKGLLEAVVLGPLLCLLARRILEHLEHLAEILVQGPNLVIQRRHRKSQRVQRCHF